MLIKVLISCGQLKGSVDMKCIECNKCKLGLAKCQLCGRYAKLENTLIIKNKINHKELRVCKECGKEFGWV